MEPQPVKLYRAPANLAGALSDAYRDPIAVTVVASKMTHGYTWLRVKDDSTEAWVAAPMLTVPDGANVQLAEYVPSQEIDPDVVPGHIHTVLFTTSVAGDLVKLHQTGEHAAIHPLLPGGAVTQTDLDIELGSFDKADHDIGELHVRRDELSGRIIAVRGQVVKVAPSVTGRHFVYLRDGTGDRYTSILPAMIERPAEPGAVLLIVGRLAVARRFLYGGTFPLLLEHGRLVEEGGDLDQAKQDVVAYLAGNATPIDAPPPPPEASPTTADKAGDKAGDKTGENPEESADPPPPGGAGTP